MSNFMGVGVFWIGLNRADLGCWRLTLKTSLKYSNPSSLSLYVNKLSEISKDL